MTFDLRLTFPILDVELDQIQKVVFSFGDITKQHGRGAADPLLSIAIVSLFPMNVEVDNETWLTVDRASRDVAMLIVHLREARLTDTVLEQLAEKDTHVQAAQWAVMHNHWTTELKRF